MYIVYVVVLVCWYFCKASCITFYPGMIYTTYYFRGCSRVQWQGLVHWVLYVSSASQPPLVSLSSVSLTRPWQDREALLWKDLLIALHPWERQRVGTDKGSCRQALFLAFDMHMKHMSNMGQQTAFDFNKAVCMAVQTVHLLCIALCCFILDAESSMYCRCILTAGKAFQTQPFLVKSYIF